MKFKILIFFFNLYVDNRFVIKEMVNSWNIAEKDAFLRFAPKYFDYVKETIEVYSIKKKEKNQLYYLYIIYILFIYYLL